MDKYNNFYSSANWSYTNIGQPSRHRFKTLCLYTNIQIIIVYVDINNLISEQI